MKDQPATITALSIETRWPVVFFCVYFSYGLLFFVLFAVYFLFAISQFLDEVILFNKVLNIVSSIDPDMILWCTTSDTVLILTRSHNHTGMDIKMIHIGSLFHH